MIQSAFCMNERDADNSNRTHNKAYTLTFLSSISRFPCADLYRAKKTSAVETIDHQISFSMYTTFN